MKPAPPANARLLALNLLSAVLDQHENLGEANVDSGKLSPRDLGFARHLAYGVLRWYSALTWLADQLLDRPLKPKDRDVYRLLGAIRLTRQHVRVRGGAPGGDRAGDHAEQRRQQRERPRHANVTGEGGGFAHAPGQVLRPTATCARF